MSGAPHALAPDRRIVNPWVGQDAFGFVQGAGGRLRDIVRLNHYTTDVPALLAAWSTLAERLAAAGCRPASTVPVVGGGRAVSPGRRPGAGA